MTFWETITGSDLTKEWKVFEERASTLPPDFQAAWLEIKGHILSYPDFSGRKLMPILDAALGLLEETAADGQSIKDALGDDIAGFTAALAGAEHVSSYRDRWRQQLNRSVANKLAQKGN